MRKAGYDWREILSLLREFGYSFFDEAGAPFAAAGMGRAQPRGVAGAGGARALPGTAVRAGDRAHFNGWFPPERIRPRSGEAAQARLLAALACPLTNGPVEIVALETAGRAVLTGAIFNRAGARVGAIDNFQVDFVRPGEGEPLPRLRRQT